MEVEIFETIPMDGSTTLTPLDTESLLAHSLLREGKTRGILWLHKRRLNRSSDEEHNDIPLDIPSSSPASNTAFSMIPTVLISRETLLYVGFSETKATEIWERWSNWPQDGPSRETDPEDGGLQVQFIDFMIGTLKNYSLDTEEDDNTRWYECLDVFGIATEVQDAIMDPLFEQLRRSQSCLYWIRDTVEMRYYGLEDIQRTSRQREMALRRANSRPGHHSIPSNQGQRSASNTQQQSTLGISTDVWGSPSSISARNAPGYISLFKAVDQGRITGLFNEDGKVENLGRLLSPTPSDFSGTGALYYFTPNYKVAEYYASYAKRRSASESIVIVCLRVPNAAIKSLASPDIQRIYWPDDEWKELIWYSRTSRVFPSHLRKYRKALLIIGTVSKKPNKAYDRIKRWENVTEANVLKVGPENEIAVQYAFSGQEDGHDFLMQHCAENMIGFPFSQSVLETWLRENS